MYSGKKTKEVTDFNEWMKDQPARHKVCIAGNHDLLFESSRELALSCLTEPIYLQDSGVIIDGVRFWGSPVQPEFCEWAFNVQRGAAIKHYWDLIPDGTDILITHGPPFGILDQANRRGEHLGCEELLKAVEAKKPKIHVFGHIHGGYGVWLHEKGVVANGSIGKAEGTIFINASFVDESYQAKNKPIVYTIQDGKVMADEQHIDE